MKVSLDVAAIRGRRSTQGSNLFQLSERAGVGGTEMRPAVCEVGGVADYGFIWTRSCLVRKHNMAASEGEVLHRPGSLLRFTFEMQPPASCRLPASLRLRLMQLLAQATNMQRQTEALEAAAMTAETGSPIFHTRLQL